MTLSIHEPKNILDESKDGKSFTIYPIQITRNQGQIHDSYPTTWTVYRRYSEFETMHARLKSLYPIVSQFEFPGKIFKGIMQMKKQLVESRRRGLEKYLLVYLFFFKLNS